MYWPLGAPRIYAAKVPLALTSDYDSEESAELIRNSLSASSANEERDLIESAKETTEDEDEGRKIGEQEIQYEESLPDTSPTVDARENERDSTSSEAMKAEARSHVVALRVARSGLVFATVTTAELTIWQTKVRTIGTVGRSVLIVE
jgi:hypothetical protein